MRRICPLLLICALLLLPVMAADTESSEPLAGKTFLVLGDSYTAGYGLSSPDEDWSYRMAADCGMTQYNFSISGSTFSAGPHGNYPMVERALWLPDDVSPDFILLQGGSNDYAKSIPLGAETDRQPDTFCGALNLILDALAEKYPDASIVCFTPWVSDDTENAQGLTSADYTVAILDISEARGVLCYDASNAGVNGMHLDRREFRAQYCLSATDWYHLNAAGHRRFAPVMEAWLQYALYGVAPTDRFYDLRSADDALLASVSALVATGTLNGASEHLFAPTAAATRASLAAALYRMAGSPPCQAHSLSDVDADTETYRAACWAMDQGIFSADDNFCPSKAVTRQMLVAVLSRCYTGVFGGSLDAVTGLGPFPDGAQVDSYARVSFGWALHAEILAPKDGFLRPQSIVSRGQLAESLARLLALCEYGGG